MDAKSLRLFIVAGAAALLIGCATTPPPAPNPPAKVQQPAAGQAAPAQQPQPNGTPNRPPAGAAKQPPKQSASNELVQKGEILVTKEEYQKTFDDVHQLIDELNRIIASRNYEAWTHHLTAKYVQTYSNPKRLDEISNQPMLKRDNLHLKTLRDYFLDVVVPSRANARLDDLDFVNKTQVKAITVIDGQRYILYDLRFVDGGWKVGVS